MCGHSRVTNSTLCFGSGTLAGLFHRTWPLSAWRSEALLSVGQEPFCSNVHNAKPECSAETEVSIWGLRETQERNPGSLSRGDWWLWSFQVEGFKLQSRNWVQSVTNDSSVPTCFSQGLVIKQLSACQVHETTSPQIGEHITVFTSVCLKNMWSGGDTAGMLCVWALLDLGLVTKHPGYLLMRKTTWWAPVLSRVSCRLQGYWQEESQEIQEFLDIGLGIGWAEKTEESASNVRLCSALVDKGTGYLAWVQGAFPSVCMTSDNKVFAVELSRMGMSALTWGYPWQWSCIIRKFCPWLIELHCCRGWVVTVAADSVTCSAWLVCHCKSHKSCALIDPKSFLPDVSFKYEFQDVLD